MRNIKKYKVLSALTLIFANLFFGNFAYGNNEEANVKISVIVPVYNTYEYLKDCLDSISGQSLKNIEIICINDGSTDDSFKIMQKYSQKDSRIKIINQKNRGASAARNAGLKVATGEYITFVDSDDTIDSDTYEISYKKAKEKNADILMFGEKNFSVTERIYGDGFSVLDIPGAMMLWNKLYKRSFLIDHNFQFLENAKCYNDECFNSVVFPKAKCIECITNQFYNYNRKRIGSIQSAASAKKKAKNTLIYADYVCNNWRQNHYIESHGYWLLKKTVMMINRSIQELETNDKYYYAKMLMDIVKKDIYNNKNISKLSKFEKILLNNWIINT